MPIHPRKACTLLLILLTCASSTGSYELEAGEFLGPAFRPRNQRSSGQVIRLRGGAEHFGEGRVEVFYGGRWGLVCDDFFDERDADVICRQLGFFNGAAAARSGGSFGYGNLRRFALDNLMCDGAETSVFHCRRSPGSDCSYKTEAAGVVCKRNYPSKCDAGGILFDGRCYYFHADKPLVFAEAQRTCGGAGGELVVVESQAENDFLSEVFFADYASQQHWYTAGKLIAGRWKWQVPSYNASSTFTKWRPGFSEASEVRDCLILRHNSADLMERNYYYWDAARCDTPRAFVCENPSKDVGCIEGNGERYAGQANVTRLGLTCRRWNDPAIVRRGHVFREQLGWSHNFCRNPDNDKAPWCMVNDHQFDSCDIPVCGLEQKTPICDPDELRCGDADACFARDFLCDYDDDCPNGFDERNCSDWLERFDRVPHRKLVGLVAEVWTFIPHAQGCAKRCLDSRTFKCRSFCYVVGSNTCILSAHNRRGGVALIKEDADYYELKSSATSSEGSSSSSSSQESCGEGEFRCDNGNCIDEAFVCNVEDSCGDRSDERNCSATPAPPPWADKRVGAGHFSLRLAGGERPSEGRVEVRAFGRWGGVCDDFWDVLDARVVCRQLGFSDALRPAVGAEFGAPSSGLYRMDNVQCGGTEASLEQCAFGGWDASDCGANEWAGVVCRTSHKGCAEKQFECDTGRCIDYSWLCDGEDDCGDASDEVPLKCNAAVTVRLADGDDRSLGRVEVQRYGVWGSVCDDDFDNEDAKVVCRMLGFDGRAVVQPSTRFGPGEGPIWLDDLHCGGDEANVADCRFLRFGLHDCEHSEDIGVRCFDADQTTPAPDSGACGRRFVHTAARDPRKPRRQRVVGGFEAPHGSFPWTVAIRLVSNDRHHCGASVITRLHLLTAAHCFEDDVPLDQYTVIVGDWHNERTDGSEQVFEIEQVIAYPEYKNVLEHDIAVIKLKPRNGTLPIQFSDFVQPICLPPEDAPYVDGMRCVVSGWGSVGIQYPTTLQAAQIPMLERAKCTHPSVYGKILSETAFCAGYLRGGIDSCQGDSGGPFACQLADKYYQLGVISWGDGCAERDRPGIYTKVTSYLPWIYEQIR